MQDPMRSIKRSFCSYQCLCESFEIGPLKRDGNIKYPNENLEGWSGEGFHEIGHRVSRSSGQGYPAHASFASSLNDEIQTSLFFKLASHSCQNNARIMPELCQNHARLPNSPLPCCPNAQSTQSLSHRIMPDCPTAQSTQFQLFKHCCHHFHGYKQSYLARARYILIIKPSFRGYGCGGQGKGKGKYQKKILKTEFTSELPTIPIAWKA